jgi:hypothetical protein
MTRRVAHAAQIGALILALALVPAGLAAKGGNGGKPPPSGGSSSIKLAYPLVYDANGNGLPNWGDTVRFDVSTTATAAPNVDLVCTQGGTVVYGATTGYYDGYLWPWTQNMKLSSQMWTGGDAACVATLYTYDRRGRQSTLATLSFTAYA